MDHVSSSAELELAHARIRELTAEIQFERRIRLKVETLNEAMSRELADERRAREAAEGLCRTLMEELRSNREEADRAKRDVEEGRRMMRTAAMWREERVHIKLAEAEQLMAQKLQEFTSSGHRRCWRSKLETDAESDGGAPTSSCPQVSYDMNGVAVGAGPSDRSSRKERAENPHIRRGIKGFVEFSRVVGCSGGRAQGSTSSAGRAQLEGSILEYQRAQLRTFLRHRNPGAGIIGGSSSENFVT